MSVRGLYDSDIGDKLAKKSLATFHKPVSKRVYTRKKCACGNELARPYINRGGKNVCVQCANTTPRKHGGHPATFRCSNCKKIFARCRLVLRQGKLYCEQCKSTISP